MSDSETGVRVQARDIADVNGEVWRPTILIETPAVFGGQSVYVREEWTATKDGLRIVRRIKRTGASEEPWETVFDYVVRPEK